MKELWSIDGSGKKDASCKLLMNHPEFRLVPRLPKRAGEETQQRVEWREEF